MFRFLAICIDVFSAAIIIVPAFVLLNLALFHENSRSRQLLYVLFALYLSAVFSFTGIPSIASLTIDLSFNLIPVIDIVNSPLNYLKSTLLNILLFVPLGFFLPPVMERLSNTQMHRIMRFGSKKELMLIIGLVFIVCFAIQPFITNQCWALIYRYRN